MAVFERVSACYESNENPEEARKTRRDMFGPQAVDQDIRQAISTCRVMLPDNNKDVAALKAEIRRLVERALQNFNEDARVWHLGDCLIDHEAEL
jgi:hypothetical protein